MLSQKTMEETKFETEFEREGSLSRCRATQVEEIKIDGHNLNANATSANPEIASIKSEQINLFNHPGSAAKVEQHVRFIPSFPIGA
jgi:hypothetical protein